MMNLGFRFVGYVIAGLLWPISIFTQTLFQDDFSRTVPGLPPQPEFWHATKGFWLADSGHVCEISGDYDAGLMLPIWVDGSFELRVRCRFPGDYAGAGFFFFSETYDGTDYAHMLRFDGRQVLMGYFLNGNYQAVRVMETPVNVLDSAWHEVRLLVDANAETYAFFVDGQRVGDPEPLTWTSGYVGLQNSGGHACFDDVRLRRLETEPGRAALAWPRAVAVSPSGAVWVAEPGRGAVLRINERGVVTGRVYAKNPLEASAKQWRPVQLATAGTTLAVLDSLHHRVHLFDQQGRWIQTLPPKVKQPVVLTAVSGAVPRLAVTDGRTIHFFAPDGESVARFTLADGRAAGLAVTEHRLAVFDAASGLIRMYEGAFPQYRETRHFTAPAGSIRSMLWVGDELWLLVGTRIEIYEPTGRQRAVLDLRGHAPVMLPAQMALHDGQVIIADALNGRLLVVPADPDRWTKLQLRESPGKLHATFQTPAGSRPFFEVEEVRRGSPVPVQIATRGTALKAQVTALQPGTLLRLRYGPLARSLPPDRPLTGRRYWMAPTPGKTPFVEIEGFVILFTRVIDSSRVTPEWPALPPLPASEVQRIRDQLEAGRRFFWMNSGMRLHLKLRYVVIDSLLERRRIFGEATYYPPRQAWIDKILQQSGGNLAKIQAVFYIACIRDYQPDTGRWELRGRGGAFTEGIGANGRYGISWWEATHAYHASGNNWLLVHEFHHQLDELFARSGFPEYWFNHFAPVAGTAADFGEHFDGNAYILRQWPRDQWFALKYGRVRFADDADGDGIPDDAPELPMDERRLGSDPRRKDSDGDGVPDLQEIAFSNWIVEGQGEIYAAPARFANPAAADTDGDGLPDGRDPWPLVPLDLQIPPSPTPALVAYSEDTRAPYRVHARYTADSLIFIIQAPPKRRIRLLIDANANGWFQGSDNLEFRLHTGDTLTARARLFNAGHPKKWPFWDERFGAGIRFTWQAVGGDRYRLAVARQPEIGLLCEPGERIGFEIGVSAILDQEGHEKYISAFEPNRLIKLVLQ